MHKAVSDQSDKPAPGCGGPVGGSDAIDHRILAVAVCPAPAASDQGTAASETSENYLVFLCDSRGLAQAHLVDVGACSDAGAACQLSRNPDKSGGPQEFDPPPPEVSRLLTNLWRQSTPSCAVHCIACPLGTGPLTVMEKQVGRFVTYTWPYSEIPPVESVYGSLERAWRAGREGESIALCV